MLGAPVLEIPGCDVAKALPPAFPAEASQEAPHIPLVALAAAPRLQIFQECRHVLPVGLHGSFPFRPWRDEPNGFLFGFLNGYDFERTLKLATGASSSDCLSVGAGLINRAQALTYAQKARVVKLA